MSFKNALIPLALCCLIASAGAQQKLVNAASHTSPTPATQSAISPADANALRDDLRRMRSLVQQMETNLAFVDTTQSPLKHQFQLEIDMWKAVIGQMERRLDAAGSR